MPPPGTNAVVLWFLAVGLCARVGWPPPWLALAGFGRVLCPNPTSLQNLLIYSDTQINDHDCDWLNYE